MEQFPSNTSSFNCKTNNREQYIATNFTAEGPLRFSGVGRRNLLTSDYPLSLQLVPAQVAEASRKAENSGYLSCLPSSLSVAAWTVWSDTLFKKGRQTT